MGRNKQWFWALLLAVGCAPAMADWIKFSSSAKSVYYIDASMLKKVDAHVMVRILRDHTSPQNDGFGPYQSSLDEIEVDCRGGRIRRMYSSDHPQPMGQGRMVHSEHGPMSWNVAAPNTIVRRIVDIACVP